MATSNAYRGKFSYIDQDQVKIHIRKIVGSYFVVELEIQHNLGGDTFYFIHPTIKMNVC